MSKYWRPNLPFLASTDGTSRREMPVDHYPDRVIPYGDFFLFSCTFEGHAYAQTNTGYFKRKHHTTEIEDISQSDFENAYSQSELFTFCPRLASPQAGLTRGLNSPFSTSDEKQKLIVEKYKNGVLNNG